MVELPKLKSVPELCFYNCAQLDKADVSGATKIKAGAFKGCKKLSIVNASEKKLDVVEKDAFDKNFLNKESSDGKLFTPEFVAKKSGEVKVKRVETMSEIFLPKPKDFERFLDYKQTGTRPLYPDGQPRPTDIYQSGYRNCWFLAALASLARSNLQAIMDCIEDHPEKGTTTISFYKVKSSEYICVPGSRVKIPVPRKVLRGIPKLPDGVMLEERDFDNSALWVQLMVSALSEYLRNNYFKHSLAYGTKKITDINAGGSAAVAFTMITGKISKPAVGIKQFGLKRSSRSKNPMPIEEFGVSKLIEQINRRDFCVAVDEKSPYLPPFIVSHSYSILGVWEDLTREDTAELKHIQGFIPNEKIKKGLNKIFKEVDDKVSPYGGDYIILRNPHGNIGIFFGKNMDKPIEIIDEDCNGLILISKEKFTKVFNKISYDKKG